MWLLFDQFHVSYVLIRSGDTEWYEGEAGGAGEGERETAGQEGAVQRTYAVSYYFLSAYFLINLFCSSSTLSAVSWENYKYTL